jgi:hypothetical protein
VQTKIDISALVRATALEEGLSEQEADAAVDEAVRIARRVNERLWSR